MWKWRKGMQKKGSAPSINAGVFSTSGLTRQQPSAYRVPLNNAHSLRWSCFKTNTVFQSQAVKGLMCTLWKGWRGGIAFSITGASRQGLCFQRVRWSVCYKKDDKAHEHFYYWELGKRACYVHLYSVSHCAVTPLSFMAGHSFHLKALCLGLRACFWSCSWLKFGVHLSTKEECL